MKIHKEIGTVILNIMTLATMVIFETFGIYDIQHNDIQYNDI
jgi:hypothetical protein